jgi:hypothetical protein
MRISRLTEWTAGAVAGCPGIIDTSAPDDSTTSATDPRDGTASVADTSTTHRPRRGRWVTAAAVILVVYGGLGIVYAPLLGGAGWTFLGAGISTVTILGVLNVATGIGLLRVHGWARITAALLSGGWLLLVHAPALLAGAANGAWYACSPCCGVGRQSRQASPDDGRRIAPHDRRPRR